MAALNFLPCASFSALPAAVPSGTTRTVSSRCRPCAACEPCTPTITCQVSARHCRRGSSCPPLAGSQRKGLHQFVLAGAEARLLGGTSLRCQPLDRRHGRHRAPWNLQIFALDAAMPFDYEAIQKRHLETQRRLKIGIVGFGNFGQFIARRIVKHDHDVIALSRSDYEAAAKEIGATYFRDADDFCEDHPDVVLFATSILSTDRVLRSLPLQRLKRSTLFVDVLSVKEFPKNLFLQNLPPHFDVLCTHPMFGPESGKGSWAGLPFVYDKVRIGSGRRNQERCKKVLQVFEKEGCRMVEMACEEHDRYAAGSQFVTHTVGRVLGKLQLESTPINTKGYETLLQLVENTTGDSFDLYYGLFMYNINATEQLNNLERAFDDVKKQLFDQLHDVLRAQLFDTSKGQVAAPEWKQKSRPALPMPAVMASLPLGVNGGVAKDVPCSKAEDERGSLDGIESDSSDTELQLKGELSKVTDKAV